MLMFVNTSILESNAQTIVNTVNTVGVMGKGLAHVMRERYPEMYRQYKNLCDQELLDVGKLWLWKGPETWVLNFPTKRHWRYPSKLDYIEAGLAKFVQSYEEKGIREISFPRLGCGNGGLAWSDVKPMMESYLRRLPIRIFIHDFEANIGASEHQVIAGDSPYVASFPAFLEDLRASIVERGAQFRTLGDQRGFTVHLDSVGTLMLAMDKSPGIRVDADELYDAWQMLLLGPLGEQHLVGDAKSQANALLALFASLPYTRAVEYRESDGDSPMIAVELIDSMAEVQTFAATM
jgi:O-acetyl-ADP-ribose deacetylase (regulator of RNase III)